MTAGDGTTHLVVWTSEGVDIIPPSVLVLAGRLKMRGCKGSVTKTRRSWQGKQLTLFCEYSAYYNLGAIESDVIQIVLELSGRIHLNLVSY